VGLFGRSFGSNLGTYSVRAIVSLPVYEGGRIDAGIRSAALKTLEAQEALRDTELQIDTDIQLAQIEMQTAIDAERTASAAVAAAGRAVNLTEARFREGLSTNVEVVAAQEALASAEAAEIGRRYAYQIARARLARARGDVMAIFDR
jgi:outer membrane protein TolC